MAVDHAVLLNEFKNQHRLDGVLPDELRPILEGLRYREQNIAIKAGATLGFGGLMIASVLVQMAAADGSMIYLAPTSAWRGFAIWGLMLLVVSSFLSLAAITFGRARYSTDLERGLGEMAAVIANKRLMRGAASTLCLLGSLLCAICLLGTLLG